MCSKNPPNLALCPACNATISSTFLDKIAAREIAALLIHCPNAVRGCLAKFALSDLEVSGVEILLVCSLLLDWAMQHLSVLF